MDKRLAAIAGGVLAAAGALGVFGRRHATMTDDRITVDHDMPLADPTTAEDEQVEPVEERPDGQKNYVGVTWSGATDGSFDLGQAIVAAQHSTAALPSVFYSVAPAPVAPTRPLSDILCELVGGYNMEADKLMLLNMTLKELGDAIEAGKLEEGTAVIDFTWSPGSGLVMQLAAAVLATRDYVRINVCDQEGTLRAPELDVHIRGDDVRVVPDMNARQVDIEERRSEALVTRLKLKAIADGVAIHPGSAALVRSRCRIVGNPFPN